MRIFKILTEHKRWGTNWSSYKVAARTAEEAIRKVKKEFCSGERVQAVEFLASADF